MTTPHHTPSPVEAAREVIQAYLRTMERRDLATARTMLAPGFTMVFPGGRRFDTLEALVESSRRRYRSALKHFDRIDVADNGDGSCTAYVFGTLYGELLTGEKYEGIRYIDRFTVRDGRLVDMMVWNDMAEILGDKLKG